MKETEKVLFHIWLSQCFPYGSVKPKQIILSFNGDLKKFYENLEENAQKFELTSKRLKKLKSKTPFDYIDIIKSCEKLKIKIVCFSDESYPKKLKSIDSSPLVLYYVGNLEAANGPSVAIVGTRKASFYGINVAKQISSELANHGITIVSGCAEGIDSGAHTGAVETSGKTISVLGTSIERPYPLNSGKLKRQIVENGGLIVSEYAPKTETFPWFFPIRNRLIVGLSNSVIIVESPKKSGAMITANIACENGKELFCVPPSNIFSHQNDGIKKCLKEGANLLLDVDDILNTFKFSNFIVSAKQKSSRELQNTNLNSVPKDLQPLFNLIDSNFDLDLAAQSLNVPINKVLEMLTRLEIMNLIKKVGMCYQKF